MTDRPANLNTLRDELVHELRALILRAPELMPGGEWKGILGRAGSLLETQLPAIDALAELDLELATLDDHDVVVEALLRARHIPKMTMALAEVLKQERKTDELAPLRIGAQRLYRAIDRLLRAWLQRQLDAAGPEGPDGEVI